MSGDMNMSATISNYTFNNNSTYCTLGKSVDYSVSIDSFHLIKVIGRGSFGKVYLVQKKSSGKSNEDVSLYLKKRKIKILSRCSRSHQKTNSGKH